MNEFDELLDFMVLKYIKKNKPTTEQFGQYIDKISYGFDADMEDYEEKYRIKKMITSGDNDDLILTHFGEKVLKNIQFKKTKEIIQITIPTGALIITTITLVYSIIFGF